MRASPGPKGPALVSKPARPARAGARAARPLHCIVLVKQVPDVSNIPEDAWDREKGTLKRAMLDSVLNPLDLQALTFARRITSAAPGSRTIYLTMGPPQARDTLIDCLSRAPGEAVLLTDRAFAGADTVATSYSLACAIRRIEKELLRGSRDYVIVTGMQSVDGDTAQVPPQVAEELGIEHIAYAQAVETEPELAVRRIGPQGTEIVRPLRYPVLVTVTACMDPLYRSFHQARDARSGPIHEWSAESVGAAPERTGLAGSRTQVYRIFSPSEERSKACEIVREPAELIERIKTRYQAAGGRTRAAEGEVYDLAGRKPTYSGEFWVLAEREGDGIRSVSLELLGKVRELADCLGVEVGAVLPCGEAGELGKELIACGADKVYALEHPLLCEFLPIPYKKAVSQLVRKHRPQVMLFGATPLGRELAPRIAYACDSGLTADCTKLEIGDHSKGDLDLVGILKQTRPALGGNIMATILTKDSVTQMATVRPGVFRVPPRDHKRKGEIIRSKPDLGQRELGVRSVAVEALVAKASIRDADIVVSGGHGLRSKADFERYLRPLADGLGRLLGGDAKVGASRIAVEDGFATHDRQVGQTGQTVQPRLYVAIGISGAVQHISGMAGSEIIVAINKDPKARIFNYADFGMVGDVERIAPALIKALEAGLASRRGLAQGRRPVKPIDVLIVGAGPAGLAAAIHLRDRFDREGREASVVVIDKAFGPGYHNLSGAALEAGSLDELLPGWRDERNLLTDCVTPVKRDEMYFLTGHRAFKVPGVMVPRLMRHTGDVTIPLSRLVQYMAQQAEKRGVEIYYGYSARSLIVEHGVVRGVKLIDVGLDKAGQPKSNYREGEEIRARVTILADGTHGVLSTQFREMFGAARNPQVYSLGIKGMVHFPGENPFGCNRVVHTLGYPSPNSVFGGGFMYSMGEKTVAVGFILGLDWKYGDLNPQREFEHFRAHPFIRRQLKGGVVLATGGKTIPEGGYLSLGRLTAPGALVAGDGGGFVNMEKIKGIHCAIQAGICAADTIAEAFPAGDFCHHALSSYRERLAERGLMREMEHARNYRQSFRWGLIAGMPLSLIQSRLPVSLATHQDRLGTKPGARLPREDHGGMDQTTYISLTGTTHREDEPSHISILDPSLCLECADRFAASCTHFCPGQVYRWAEGEAAVGAAGGNGSAAGPVQRGGEIALSPSNCLHCMTCAVKCPYANIRWLPPEGGEGPRYKAM